MHKVFCPLLRPDGAASHTMQGVLVSGIHTGPTMLVPLARAQVDTVVAALKHLPRIGDIYGQIALVNIGAIGAETAQDDWLRTQIGQVDDTLYLSTQDPCDMEPRAVRKIVAAILDKARSLGMISGRGVTAFHRMHSSKPA